MMDRVPAPELVYSATLIIGASNVPDILDVSQLAPGTIVIDDRYGFIRCD